MMVRNGFILAFLAMVWSCGSATEGEREEAKTAVTGKALYKTHCAICHGSDGKKGLAGAKMLPDSKLTIEERMLLITHGRGTMMPYKGILSKEEIRQVAEYTLTLK